MTSLRWLQWPMARRRRPGIVTYAHAFRLENSSLALRAVCGVLRPAGRQIAIVNPALPHEQCSTCDERLRKIGGPHPKPSELNTDRLEVLYDPRYTFDDWEASL